MRTYADCVPCFVRQAIDAGRMACDDADIHERILRATLKLAAEFPFDLPPPHMGAEIHRITREISGNPDPYREVKRHFNAAALAMLDELRETVDASDDPFLTAVRLAIAGNVIDFGIAAHQGNVDLGAAVRETLSLPLAVDDTAALRAALDTAQAVLYLADNAGEIVLDRLLIEEIGPERVTVVVKSGPIINDVTMADAEETGLTGIVPVIENGGRAPGTILAEATPELLALFEAADVVIAKGQGNYETLSDCERGDVFFLLKAKCAVIARDMGCELGGICVVAKAAGKASGCVAAVDAANCCSCGRCAQACPVDAPTMTGPANDVVGKTYAVDADACTGCGACLPVCPMEAIALSDEGR